MHTCQPHACVQGVPRAPQPRGKVWFEVSQGASASDSPSLHCKRARCTVNGLVGGYGMGKAWADGAGAMETGRVTAAASADTCVALRSLLS